MLQGEFDRDRMVFSPLKERKNLIDIEQSFVGEKACETIPIPKDLQEKADVIARQIMRAKASHASVMCTFGAHTIKNGLGPLLSDFIEKDWFTHLATNGAGIIHDWEFAYQGSSSEDVRENVKVGQFGTWEETGSYLNLALIVGAYEGRGYGESVGSMLNSKGLHIPELSELYSVINNHEDLWKRSAGIDLLETMQHFSIPSGFLSIPHKDLAFSAQLAAFTHDVPFTGHPMFGHDIIYTHKMNKGSSIGRTAERDFLKFVQSVSHLEKGVYLSVGSAVMSPMIFEKALSMARNVALQEGREISDCTIVVVDLMENSWDWSQGEPPKENPAYYQRFMKTFSRMGCNTSYICADNRLFLCALHQALKRIEAVQ
ncbi:MAG TPA: hypothetical protein VJ869_03995 [Sphaerochaeta sp.]|nr:hypothetical protein [Sphaerochaeta sp.]